MRTRTIFLLVLLTLAGVTAGLMLGLLVSGYFLVLLPISGLPLGAAATDLINKYYDRRWQE